MDRVILFATPTAPIDVDALRAGIGFEVDIVAAPPACLRKPLDDASERCLCELAEAADALFFRVGQVTRSIIEAAPNLRIVAVHGVGTDSVDVATASKRKVFVTVTPGANANAVAEYVICALLLSSRRLDTVVGRLRDGGWNEARVEGFELSGKTIGIVGFGAVGSRIAQLGDVFGMQVLVSRHARLTKCRYTTVDLDELVQEVDFLVIAVPRRPETEGLISESLLRKMRKTAILVNVSRGGIVDEVGLMRILDDGAVAEAWIDVFRHEPVEAGNPLLKHPRVRPTPHLAGSTRESLARTALQAGQDIALALRGERPRFLVNDV